MPHVNIRKRITMRSNNMSTTDWIELSIHTSIHCILMITFLTLFYFFYVYPLEKSTLEKTLNDLIAAQLQEVMAMQNPFLIPSDAQLDAIITREFTIRMNQITIEAANAEKKIDRMRTRVIIFSFSLIGIISIVLILIYSVIFRMIRGIRIHFYKIAYSVMYSILFVIMIEIFFFLTVTKKLQPVSSEELQLLIYTNTETMIKDYLAAHRTTNRPTLPLNNSHI